MNKHELLVQVRGVLSIGVILLGGFLIINGQRHEIERLKTELEQNKVAFTQISKDMEINYKLHQNALLGLRSCLRNQGLKPYILNK